jgi:hypothetical protein
MIRLSAGGRSGDPSFAPQVLLPQVAIRLKPRGGYCRRRRSASKPVAMAASSRGDPIT